MNISKQTQQWLKYIQNTNSRCGRKLKNRWKAEGGGSQRAGAGCHGKLHMRCEQTLWGRLSGHQENNEVGFLKLNANRRETRKILEVKTFAGPGNSTTLALNVIDDRQGEYLISRVRRENKGFGRGYVFYQKVTKQLIARSKKNSEIDQEGETTYDCDTGCANDVESVQFWYSQNENIPDLMTTRIRILFAYLNARNLCFEMWIFRSGFSSSLAVVLWQSHPYRIIKIDVIFILN